MKGIVLLITLFSLWSCKTEVISFAVTADIHQDIMHDGEERLQTFLDAAQENNGDYHFIILDANNLYIDSSKRAFIDPEQIEWLKQDLASTSKHCIVFSHQSLENTLNNGSLVRSILENENDNAGFTKVIAAFSGHDHTSYMKEINEISYVQINSASNQWVGEKYKCPERFSESINKKRPSLKYTTPYKDALYSIVYIYGAG